MSPSTFRRLLGAGERDTRLPPGQYDAGADWPVLTAEVTPRLDRDVDAPRRRARRAARRRGPGTRSTRRPVRRTRATSTASPPGRSSARVQRCLVDTLARGRRRAAGRDARRRLQPHRVHHEPAARRRHRGQGVDRVGARGKPLPPSTAARSGCSCRTCTSGRARSGSPGRLLDHDEPGFWEQRGYHELGDPWREQRYDGD